MSQMRFSFLWIAFVFSYTLSFSQSFFSDGLTPAFHKDRREALRDLMPSGSMAIFFSQPVMQRSGDTDFPYRPHSDLFYLTGFREPNAILILFKESVTLGDGDVTEMMFVRERNASKEQWDGKRLGPDGVKQQLLIDQVYPISDFMKRIEIPFSAFSKVLYLEMPTFSAKGVNKELGEALSKFESGSKDAKLDMKVMASLLDQLRGIKSIEEIVLIKKAIEITGKGHIEAMRSAKMGTSERALKGVHEFVHQAYGAEGQSYESIVGAGNNACILHYVDNTNEPIREGLILMDVGAEYKSYAADITRTVPINGVFSNEEKALYNIVLKALDECIEICKPGASFLTLNQKASAVIQAGLEELGIVQKGKRHGYFPHGVSHHLGLDVHDRGSYQKMLSGMVITVEPGIYIPEGSPCDPKWWGIGIRIEDNILITNDGNENLSSWIPRTVEDIEMEAKKEGILQLLFERH